VQGEMAADWMLFVVGMRSAFCLDLAMRARCSGARKKTEKRKKEEKKN